MVFFKYSSETGIENLSHGEGLWWCLETGRQNLSLIPHRNADCRNWGVRKVNQLRISDIAWKWRMSEKSMLSVNNRGERKGEGSFGEAAEKIGAFPHFPVSDLSLSVVLLLVGTGPLLSLPTESEFHQQSNKSRWGRYSAGTRWPGVLTPKMS